MVNPSFVPVGGLTASDLDSGLFGVGTLNIGDGGDLIMADPRITGAANMYDGPSYAFVDTLNVGNDGTLTYELQPASGGPQPVGSYAQIFADTANLAGTLVAQITTPNGLFADSYSWQNVIDANALEGTFDHCQLAGPYAGSLLLTFGCGSTIPTATSIWRSPASPLRRSPGSTATVSPSVRRSRFFTIRNSAGPRRRPP